MATQITKKMMVVQMTEQEYMEGSEGCQGVCLACGDTELFGVEPDARHYECESCGEKTVFGYEEALFMGGIVFV